MNNEQSSVIKECAALSVAGKIAFPQVVTRLSGVGVERYHADFGRMETTYYLADGGSCVVPMVLDAGSIARDFQAAEVKAAVGRSQRGELTYRRFVETTMAAGCVGYFVQIAGRRVQYFGREGEIHTEWFPSAKPD